MSKKTGLHVFLSRHDMSALLNLHYLCRSAMCRAGVATKPHFIWGIVAVETQNFASLQQG